MKEKGFTLIELLAVIVILAIIALIAVPIVLNIINDAQESSNERSMELYGEAVENAIMAYKLKGGKNPASINELNMSQYSKGDVKCDNFGINENGTIYLNKCSVNGSKKIYSYGKKLIICKAATEETASKNPVTGNLIGSVPTGNYNPGDEYICTLETNKVYNFFVLSKNGDKVDLIMDSNIDPEGNPIKTTTQGKGLVAWLIESDYSDAGVYYDEERHEYMNYNPYTAMKYLNSIVSDWDEIVEGVSLPSVGVLRTLCTGGCPLWLTNYLDDYNHYEGRTGIPNLYGYWTKDIYYSNTAYYLDCVGDVTYYHNDPYYSGEISSDKYFGVRPVITVSAPNLK